jgi:hypothetical protein
VHTRGHRASRVIRIIALASVVATSACSHSLTAPRTGSLSGIVSSSLGGGLAGVSVVVTPTSGSALPAVITDTTGAYQVTDVPIGSGLVAVSKLPSGCATPNPTPYSLGTPGATATANITVTCHPPGGTISGTVATNPGGVGIASATVTVTPSGAGALPSVTTSATGTYSVAGIPIGAGAGSIAVSNLPTGCTPPSATPYSGLTAAKPLVINIGVTCPTNVTSLAVGQAAIFTGSPAFETTLSLAPNGIYLITVVNTDSASASLEDFQIAGSLVGVSAATRGRAPTYVVASQPRRVPLSPARPATTTTPPAYRREMAFMRRSVRNHLAVLEDNRRILERHGNPLPQLRADAAFRRAQPPAVTSRSLVGTKVGDVNKVYVRTALLGMCSQVDSIGARTVYVGTHVQVIADTSLTNWPSQFRFDSAYYHHFGVEYDTLTYAKHLLTYIGDPLQLDRDLSGVGKVTIVFTPVINNFAGGIIAMVSPCDFYSRSVNPFSNLTEMIYMSVPSASGFDVSDWEGFARSTAAHESKHVVSIGDHIIGGTYEPELVWLEEGLAQVSSEIWGRNYNLATWRSDAGFDQTVGCEPTFFDPISCQTPNSPFTFTFSHFPFLFTFLEETDSTGLSPQESFSGSIEGKYGAGWNFARWAIDNYATGSSAAAEGGFIKSMITNTSLHGLANVSNATGAPVPDMLVYWSLATALDQSTLLDSASFIPQDARVTVPSFDLRNIYAVLFTQASFYPLPAPLRPYLLTPGPFQFKRTGIPGTGKTYWLLPNGPATIDEQLQLLNGTGGPISPSSGFRVGIVREQ